MRDIFERIPLGDSALRGFGLFVILPSLSLPSPSCDPSFSSIAALPQPSSFSPQWSSQLFLTQVLSLGLSLCLVFLSLHLPHLIISPDSGDPLSNHQLLTFQSCQSD